MSSKPNLRPFAEKIAKALAQGKPPPASATVLRQLESSPDPFSELLDGLGAGPDPDSPLAAAHYFLLATQLTELRYRIDRGHAEARAAVDAFLDEAVRRVREGILPEAALVSFGVLLHEAGLPPSPAFAAALAEILEAGQPPGTDPGQLLGQLSESLGDDPFEVVQGLGEVTHAFPADLRQALPGILWQSPAFREAVPLMALDGLEETRAHALEALSTAPKALSGDAVRRLITLRNWLPERERPALDRVVAAARKQGVACAPAAEEHPARIEASLMDGSGAQGILLVSQAGKHYRLGSILIRRGFGILDAWCAADALSKQKADASLRQARKEGQTQPVSRQFLETAVRHHLAVGLDNGRTPPVGLLQVAEGLGTAPWLPEKLDIAATLKQLGGEAPEALPVEAGLIWQGDGRGEASRIMDSWFEQDHAVDGLLRRTRRRKPEALVRLILDEILEARREKWTETLVWTVLWCREGPPALRRLMPGFLAAAVALHQGRPMAEIPLIVAIAGRTLMAQR